MEGSLMLADSSLPAIGHDPVFAGIVIAILGGLFLGSLLISKLGESDPHLRPVPEFEDPDPCAFCEKRVVLDWEPDLTMGFPMVIPFPEIYHSCGSNCERKADWADRNRDAIRKGVA